MSAPPSIHDAVDVAFFRALSEPRRLDVLAALLQLGGSANVGSVAERVDVDPSVVSRHIKELARAGVVTVERQGRERRVVLAVDRCLAQLGLVVTFLERVRSGLPCC